ncbi:MAG: stage II sporulation protein M [Nanoarchaeota archaeon]|nr:stage II sporulation protein M [Nanoarchaeota archaeon]
MKKKTKKRAIEKRNLNGNTINRNIKRGFLYLYSLRYYVLFSFLLFLFTGLFGYFYPYLFQEEIIKLIEQIVNQTKGLGLYELIAFIITNNAKSAFFGFILGLVFAIVPISILVVNGYIVGFVANKASNSAGILVLWRLLPHGIFEIPAIMISVALGIKLGISLLYDFYGFYNKGINKYLLCLLAIFSIIFVIVAFPMIFIITLVNPVLREKIFKNFKDSLFVFIFIVIPLLVIAGIIEGILITAIG